MAANASLRRLEEAVESDSARLRAAASGVIERDGGAVLSGITAGQVVGGLRGVTALICETSSVAPDRGLSIRGRPILELVQCSPEEIFWLLATGRLPAPEESAELRAATAQCSAFPEHLQPLLAAFPLGSHPMVLLSACVMAMRRESRFAAQYGVVSGDALWRAALHDAVLIFSRLPALAAHIYRHCQGSQLSADAALLEGDWAGRLSRGLGTAEPGQGAHFTECLRLLAVVQSDHEGANACALAANAVASALADPFLALSAGLNALAGPVHGLASEMSLRFILGLLESQGAGISEESVIAECSARLARGQVIPGFGHAVLRAADPRFIALQRFAADAMPDDPVYRVCEIMSRRVPDLLAAHGRAKNPWPNIDFISGPVLYHFGLRDARFLTVVFGISLAIGVLAQYVVNRALGAPLLRPRSIGLAALRRVCEEGGAA